MTDGNTGRMEGKSSFLLYGEIEYYIDGVSDEDCGRLFRAILRYVNTKEVEAITYWSRRIQ